MMGVALLGLAGAPATAQMPSAKTGAVMSDLVLIPATAETSSWDAVLSTAIKVPEQKELVFDVTVQCGLYTDTAVRSKGGGKDTSSAEAAVAMRVKVENLGTGEVRYAEPNGTAGVTYCSRKQELSGQFQGIIEGCVDAEGHLDINDGCLAEEEVQLILTTLNANAFNFVLENLVSGEYEVTAEAEITSATSSQSGSADAWGMVGLGSMVVDEVRFVK
jgi:hypothetical protein